MYCRNCGNEMHDEAVVCVKCGVPAGKGKGFCRNCGEAVGEEAIVCLRCGSPIEPAVQEVPVGEAKSKIAAGLLGIFLGALGIHNFYLGFTGKAVAQLLMTVLSCGFLSFASGVWGLVEGIMYLTGSLNKDAKGQKLGE